MDSFTQIALGAAVGEATLGRKVGNKAVLWGAVGGLIPDLDILAAPFLDAVERFTYHRSLSHSFLFALLASPLLGYMVSRIHRRAEASWRDWSLLFLLTLGTHWMLDSLTTYGTQVFWPFSDTRVAFDSIFIVDLFYSIPLLAAVITILFLRSGSRARSVVVATGLAVTTLYLVAGLGSKYAAERVFERELVRQDITYESYITTPTPTNIVLWRLTARSGGGYYTGFYSVLDDSEHVELRYVPGNHHLIDGIRGEWAVDRLVWFSRGYYSVSEADGELHFNNLIFGNLNAPGQQAASDWVFSFRITPGADGLVVSEREKSFESAGGFLRGYYRRAIGQQVLRSVPPGFRSAQSLHEEELPGS